MKRLFAFALFTSLAACSQGAAPAGPAAGAPPRPPSALELAAQGPEKSADTLTLLSRAHDAARLGAALVAAESCPALDRACRETRKREGLEAFASSTAALELLIAARAELFPGAKKAFGPDTKGLYEWLGLAPAP